MEDYLSEEEIDALEYKLLVEWLETVPTTDWHLFAQNWNYDNSKDILYWLVDNPRTERATALLIYWMLGARFFKQYATAAEARVQGAAVEKNWHLVHKLEANYLRGFYAAGPVGFNPAHDESPNANGYDWTADYQDEPAALAIPALLVQAVPGIQPADNWTKDAVEGIPAHIWEELETHYGDEEEDEGNA